MTRNHLHVVGRSVAAAAITASLVTTLGCGFIGRAGSGETRTISASTEEDVVCEDAKVTSDALSATTESLSPEEGLDPFNTEEYDSLDEQGFIAAATRPLSTVSSDVDTASYCNLRRMLNDGWSAEEIDSGAVRIEEMLNYFDYDYAGTASLDQIEDLVGTGGLSDEREGFLELADLALGEIIE